MSIFVAGGAGFIGSHLCDELLKHGHQVICGDKLVMGEKNISHLRMNPSFQFIRGELADSDVIDGIFREAKERGEEIESVYHLAANSDIQKGGKEPAVDFNDTFLTTRILLETMRRYDVKNLFFASTSAVYGEMCDEVLTELTGGLMPVSYYGGCKLASEALIYSYTAMCDMNTVIFRFPNVIGPGLTHGVIYDFIKKLQNDPGHLEILGDGTQCKPYIYVCDLVEAIIILTESWKPGAELFNISVNSSGTSVKEIADIICSEMKLKDVKYHFTGGDRGWKGDVPRFSYDISKILNTGWVPKYTSDEAVRQSVRDAIK